MMTDTPDIIKGRVSVIIPTFNRAALVAEVLASVSEVSWADVEVIVVDDGSTDDTSAVVKGIRDSDYPWPLEYVWQENAGPAKARNYGRSRSRGEYIYHLDSDDLVYADAFSALISAMQNEQANYAIGVVENTNLAGERLVETPFSTHKIVRGQILASNWYTHAALYRREVLDSINGYNEDQRTGEDTELHWRIMATSGWPAEYPGLIAARREHDLGNLGRKSPTRSGEVNAILRAYECFFEACPIAFSTVANALRVLRFGVVSGLDEDQPTKKRCAAILRRMRDMPASALLIPLLLLTLRPNSVVYYRALHLALRPAAIMRRLIKSSRTTKTQTNG